MDSLYAISSEEVFFVKDEAITFFMRYAASCPIDLPPVSSLLDLQRHIASRLYYTK